MSRVTIGMVRFFQYKAINKDDLPSSIEKIAKEGSNVFQILNKPNLPKVGE